MKRNMRNLLMLFLLSALFCLPLKADAAAVSGAGRVTVSSGTLNVRASPGTSSAVTGSIAKGAYVTLLYKSGNWWYVQYGAGQYGYCHADYISAVSDRVRAVSITSGSLNVRAGGGTSYAVIDRLQKGEQVVVLTAGTWSRVLYGGANIGFVSSGYLAESAAYPAVRLNVPDMKQTDVRWANVYVGSSGKTIGKIGCATTGLSMLESCRTGRTVTPAEMVKSLTYDGAGNLYWPSWVTTVTDTSNCLSAVYSLLRAGKPVLLGVKKYDGGQHWVVVTGFTGGQTLTPAAFLVNDPGSASRRTLADVLAVYPVYYKYLYAKCGRSGDGSLVQNASTSTT